MNETWLEIKLMQRHNPQLAECTNVCTITMSIINLTHIDWFKQFFFDINQPEHKNYIIGLLTHRLLILQPKMFYVQRVSSTLLWDFGAKAERARTIVALRLARHEGQDGRFMGHAPYVVHGPRNALRTGSLIGRHLYLCTMTVVVT